MPPLLVSGFLGFWVSCEVGFFFYFWRVISGTQFRVVLLLLLLLGLLSFFVFVLCDGFFFWRRQLVTLGTDVGLEQTVTVQKEVLVLCGDTVCVVFWQLLPPYGFP